MDILSYSRGEQQKSWYFTYFWESHHAWNTHKIVSSHQTDHITHGTISHVQLIHAQWTGMEKPILPKSWQDQPKSQQLWQDQPKS